MTIITSKYRSDAARFFVEDVTVNDYYLFASSISNTAVENTAVSKRSFLEKTIFGKKLPADNLFYVIENNVWRTGTVYTQYDDKTDLSDERYYVTVYPADSATGDYKIYKCLFNNYGGASINPPNYQSSTPNQIYIMPDGYTWKYMYSLSVSEFEKYNTRGYIPIIDVSVNRDSANNSVSSANNSVYSANNSAITSKSSINQIFVENLNQNTGYESIIGTIFQVARSPVNEITIIPNATNTLNGITNYYSGYTFYVTNQNVRSQTYEVDTYTYDPVTGRATITLIEGTPTDGVLVDTATFNLLPRVEIQGDGSGAVAIPSVAADGSISSVTVLNSGSDYTNATAKVVDPFAFDPNLTGSLDVRAILRPILSPVGGHGSNLVEEFNCTRVLAYTDIDAVDNALISNTNTYGSIGIVKNPEFKDYSYPTIFDNRIELAVDANLFTVNETITQIETVNTASDFFGDVRFSAKVHEVSGDFIYLAEYLGPYPNDQGVYANTDFSDISLDVTLPLITSQGQIIQINTDNNPAYTGGYDSNYPGFKLSPYVQRTGEVYYMHRFVPITRTANSREQYKIILEF